MATTIPCIKGKMGSIDYYLATMKAGEVIARIRTAKEIPGWDEMGIEERMQREINWDRVENEIARYLAEDPDHFFGALVVGIYHSQGMEFEPLEDIPGIPKIYQNAIRPFGLLHMHGGELLFALDGQHRLKGDEVAITGLTHDGDRVETFKPNPDLAEEDISLVLFAYEPEKRSRKVFNKINKYAKQTSKGDNIITSEDDAFAIIARWLMGTNGHAATVKQDLVNWKSNTLANTHTMFTTVSVLYESAKTLLVNEDVDPQFRPKDKDLGRYYEEVRDIWAALLADFKPFHQAVTGDKRDLPELRQKFLALKPVGQMAIMEGVQFARTHGVDLTDIIKALNRIPWELNDKLWLNVLVMPGGKVHSGKTTVRLAARIIARMVGAKFTDEERDSLLTDYRNALGNDGMDLPAAA